jgi:hypothetical protein
MAGDLHVTAPAKPVIETKVAAGSATGIVTGLLSWALVSYIPAWHNGIPATLLPFIPAIAGWLCATAAGYLAPHTSRPDLAAAPNPFPAEEERKV